MGIAEESVGTVNVYILSLGWKKNKNKNICLPPNLPELPCQRQQRLKC